MRAMKKIRSLSAIVARLSKRERIIFFCAVFILSLTLLDRLVIHPIFYKIRSLDKEIEEMKTGIKKNLHILAHKERILADRSKYSSFAGGTESGEEKATSVLKEIENLADKAAIYLIDMKPAGIKETDASRKFSIDLNCEAQMEQLVDFMHSVESSDTLLTIEKYQISPKSKDLSVARCKVTISTILIDKGGI